MFPPSPQCTQSDIGVNLLITTVDPPSKKNINFVQHLEVKILSQPALKNNFPSGGQVGKNVVCLFQQQATSRCGKSSSDKPQA